MGAVVDALSGGSQDIGSVLTLGGIPATGTLVPKGVLPFDSGGDGGALTTAAPPLAPVSPTPPPAPTLNDTPVATVAATTQKAVNNDPATGKAIGAASQILTSPISPTPPGAGAAAFLGDTPAYISNKKKLLGN